MLIGGRFYTHSTHSTQRSSRPLPAVSPAHKGCQTRDMATVDALCSTQHTVHALPVRRMCLLVAGMRCLTPCVGGAYCFTPAQEGIDAISDVIQHVETYDVTTIRASTPMFLMSRKIKAIGVKMVLSGEGSDEVFGGYLYFHKAPNKVRG